jgi:hypothetical protein
MLEKEFVPYEEALALKELGFDEPCFAFYDESLYFPNNENQYGTFCNQKLDASSCSAPTFSQAFRWFRENHSLFPYVEYLLEEKFDYVIVSKMYDKPVDYLDGKFDTYEEAELACLKKLIEIKNEQQ